MNKIQSRDIQSQPNIARVGRQAPPFYAQAYENGQRQISLSDYYGQYVLLFFYPLDFGFVCPTEIVAFSDASDQFNKIDCQILGCSVDSQYVHSQFIKQPRNKGGLGEIKIPLLSDVNKSISKNYGVLMDEGEYKGASYRATFIIDSKGIIRHMSINDINVGRSIDEYYRLVQAFQFTDQHGELCPSKWKPGNKGIPSKNNPSNFYSVKQNF